MAKLAVFGVATGLAAAAVVLPSPAGSGDPAGAKPDGLLVLGAIGSRDDSDAVTRELAMVVNPRSGATRSHRLPGGALCGGSVLAGGDGVVFSDYEGRRAVAHTLPLGLTGRPRSLGRAELVAPAGATGRVLVARARYRRRATILSNLRELGPEGGAPLAGRLELPGWAAVEGTVDGALLVTFNRSLALWEPENARPRRIVRRAHLIAAGERGFAWCQGRCRTLALWTRGGERRLTTPAGTRPQPWLRGALSPDGRRLALALRTPAGTRAAVVDLIQHSWKTVPNGRLGGYQAMAWSPSGEWLYFTAGERRVLSWRRGAPRAVRIPMHAAEVVMSLATT
jgi:hypothetical protein